MGASNLKYVDYRPMFFSNLKFYKGGLKLPSGENIVKCTDKEKIALLKMKNGIKNCFEEIENKRTRKSETIDEGGN